jgi:hypothetical protein
MRSSKWRERADLLFLVATPHSRAVAAVCINALWFTARTIRCAARIRPRRALGHHFLEQLASQRRAKLQRAPGQFLVCALALIWIPRHGHIVTQP